MLSCEVQMSEFEDVVRMSRDLSVVILTLDAMKGALFVVKSWLTKSKLFLASDLSLMPVSNSLLRVDTLKNLVSESKSLKILVGEQSLLEDVFASFMQWACVNEVPSSFYTTGYIHGHHREEPCFTVEIWEHLKHFTGISNIPFDLSSIVDFLILVAKMRSARSVIGKLIFTAPCYFIWKERNDRLFMKKKRYQDQFIHIIKSNVRLKLLMCRFKKTTHVHIGCFEGGVLTALCTLFSFSKRDDFEALYTIKWFFPIGAK
uniref:ARID DNA-binding domain-containing protein n=1 Tax=Tanacetum cinerariifolium TaxID=118510 RepID=A0A6L2JQ96_TANCI|nr:ARID DNA-binding domain-containing protein [Tanacetum cinerariifolium]